jgi:hypothetical protein
MREINWPGREADQPSVASDRALDISIAVLPVVSPCRLCTTPGVYSGDPCESGTGDQLPGIVPKMGLRPLLQHLLRSLVAD